MTSPTAREVVEGELVGREVPEWIGKTVDTPVPRAVRARVFRRYGGRCYLSGRKIGAGDAWEIEHIKPLHLARPGENLNRESNLAPALKAAHAEKSAAETSARAKADRIHAKHFGYWPQSKNKLHGRGFSKGRNRAHQTENNSKNREKGL